MAEVPKSVKASLYIDGKPAEATIKNLNTVTQNLRRELNNLTIGTDAWNQKMKEVQQNAKYLQDVKDEVKGVGGAFSNLGKELGKLGSLAVGYLGLQFVSGQFQNIILANAKLSDSLADIRRVAGLTEQEVLSLNNSLSQLNTRTSTEGLREIAIIAGKLGVAKGDILGFVEATDKLVVTLGDELGNADQITTQLGKILNVFDGHVDGDNITKLGNAMVVLANAGVASGGFIADFTQRVAGIAKTANLSLGATVGLAAGLEELGAKSESASTAVSRLLTDIASNIPKAARIAKQPVEDFQKLFAEAPEKALIAYAKGLTQNKQAFSDVATSFKDAGEEGARVITTLSAIGGKAEFMQGKIDLAKKSLQETDAINAGFALKNDDLAASVDKLSKEFTALTANKSLMDFFSTIIVDITAAIEAINGHAAAIARMIKILIVAGVAWGTYKLYVAAANTSTFAFITTLVKGESVMALSRTAGLALAVTTNLLAGNFEKAAQAARLLWISLEANPIGLVLGAMAAAVAAVVLFKDSTNDAAAAQKTLNDIQSEAADKIADEKDRIESLVKIINDQNEAYSDRIAAINALRKLLPDHLAGYTNEKILAGQAKTAIDEYVKSLEKKAEAEVAYDKLKMLKAEQRDLQDNGDNLTGLQQVGLVLRDIFTGTDNGQDYLKKQGAANKANALRTNQIQQNAITDKFKGDLKKQLLEGDGTGTGDGLGAGDAAANTLDNLNKKLADLRKQKGAAILDSKEFLDLDRQIRDIEAEIAKYDDKKNEKKDNTLANQKNAYLSQSLALSQKLKEFNAAQFADTLSQNDKEVAALQNKYDKEIDSLQKFISDSYEIKNGKKQLKPGASQAEIDKHQAEIDKLNLDKNKAVNDLRIKQEQDLNDKINDFRDQMAGHLATELQKETDQINKFYDDLAKNSAQDEKTQNEIKLARQQALNDAKLRNEKNFQDDVNKVAAEGAVSAAERDKLELARINKKYDDEIEALKRKYGEEYLATKEGLALIASINKNRQNEINQSDADKKKKALLDERNFAIDTTKQIADAAFEIGKRNREADTDARIKSLEAQKDKELSNKNLTETQKQAIQDKYAKKEADIKLQAWKADQQAAEKQAVIDGALAVLKALSQVGPLGAFVIPGIIAETAVQTALIASQKPPQFAGGGYSDDDPAGYVGQPTVFRKSASGRPFVAGEAGREWIAPNWMLQNPRTANLIGMLEIARREKRGFAAGGYNDAAGTGQASAFDYTHLVTQNALLMQQNALLGTLTKRFDDFANKPWDFNYRAFTDFQSKVNAINQRAGKPSDG